MKKPNFWQSPTIEELAESQGVKPITDVHKLFGTWPGEDDDGFEESIYELRQGDKSREKQGREA